MQNWFELELQVGQISPSQPSQSEEGAKEEN